MGGNTQMQQGDLRDRLSAQIESLQGSFRRLSKASTVKDLAGQFTGVVRGMFPDVDVDLLLQKDRSGQWEYLVDGGVSGKEHLATLPPGQDTSVCTVHEMPTGVCIVQKLVDGSFIAMVLARKFHGTGAIDILSLRLFLHLFDTAYQDMLYRRNEKELIFSLNHRVLQLNSLIDTGIEVSKLDQDASPQHLALERAASLTNASKGVVRVIHKGVLSEEIYFPAGVPFTTTVDARHRITTSFVFGDSTYAFELFEKESRAGLLAFDETDQLLLDALARQVHASLENRYLHEQALEKQKIEQDMAVAASIQQRILPASLPPIAGYDIAGINIPSKSVGGDYYDCIPLPDGKYALVVADVAGKGVPAALLVSSLHAYLSAYLEGASPLVRLVQKLNTVICRASTDEKFITAFFALLSPETGAIESVNAGHNPAYVLRKNGTVHELNEGGVALGMLDIDFPFQSELTVLEKGERLLLYTDGIPEATNERQQMFESETPLKELVARHKPDQAEIFIRDLIGDIKRFTGNYPQSDDITALYLLRR